MSSEYIQSKSIEPLVWLTWTYSQLINKTEIVPGGWYSELTPGHMQSSRRNQMEKTRV